jgi:hypothetical protein
MHHYGLDNLLPVKKNLQLFIHYFDAEGQIVIGRANRLNALPGFQQQC